jgi:uncharacterized protein YjeT (DUF2065 family)
MRRFLGYVLGAVLALNGLAMLAAPLAWYGAVPGVTMTGPFNPHFVRDIGAAYLACGAALAWFATRAEARPAAQIAALFLGVHALVHLWDAVAGRETWGQLLIDLPGVFLPPALAVWIAWPRRPFSTGVQVHDPLVP